MVQDYSLVCYDCKYHVETMRKAGKCPVCRKALTNIGKVKKKKK